MRTIHNLRRFLKMGGNARYLAAAAIAMFAFTAAAEINPGDYISGATCEMNSSSRLTVTGGEGTLNVKLPAEITELVVTNGASLKIGIADPFAAKIRIYLYGDAANGKFATLDVNGHDLDISVIGNPWSNSFGDPSIHPGPGRVINTSATAAEIKTVESCHFWGVYEELSGQILLTTEFASDDHKNLQVTPVVSQDGSVSAPSQLTLSGSMQLQVIDNPLEIMFLFEDSTVGNWGNPVRLSEIQLTYRGVPVPVGSVWTASKSSDASMSKDYLIDGRTDTGRWGSGGDDKRVVLTLSESSAVDGYRIASALNTSGESEDSYRPQGWKVYIRRIKDTGWFLVDDKSGAAASLWPPSRSANSFTPNILFSAASRSGALTGPNTALVLNNTWDWIIRLLSAATMEVASVSGTSTSPIRIENGGAFTAGDLTGFFGSFAASSGQGRLFVSGETNAEQPVSVLSGHNIAIANGGTAPASVLLDNMRSGHFFGTMKDGENGTLGLVKRGDGERVLETEAASYTGPTAIHAGTLTIARRRTYTARYIRVKPLRTNNADGYGYPWSMNEFTLLDADGNAILWPDNTQVTKPSNTHGELGAAPLKNLADNNTTSSMTMPQWNTWVKNETVTSATDDFPAATIDAGKALSFSAYRWTTCLRGWVDYHERVPLEWQIDISSDGVNWEKVDVASYAWTSADEDAYVNSGANGSITRGPFAAGGSSAESQVPYTGALDASLYAAGTDRDTSRPLSARYFRVKFLEIQRPSRAEYSYGVQLAEFSLWKNGERIEWPGSASAAVAGANVSVDDAKKLVNNDWTTTDNSGRCYPSVVPCQATIDAGETIDFDSYSFASQPGDYPFDKTPKAWILEVSNDGENFTAIDEVGNWIAPESVKANTTSNSTIGPFNVAGKHPYLHSSAANSIGDKSPVSIDSGATLKIAANYEKFGPLSGAGTLDLVCGAVAEVNATGDATFSGSVTGDGVFAVCGNATQTLSGAALSGVKTLELNGGTLAGTASFGGGDLTLEFNGGALGAQLSGIGTLNVSGSVKYAVPADDKLHKVTVLSARVITPESQEKLRTGEIVGGDWSVHTVTDTKVILRNNKSFGLIFIVH